MSGAKLPAVRELYAWIRHAKHWCERCGSIDLTVGWSPDTSESGVQTGDNSYTGAAYFYPVWAVVSVARSSKARDIVRELHDQLMEGVA